MSSFEKDQIRQAVRQRYALVAQSRDAGCDCGATSCCGTSAVSVEALSGGLGYTVEDLGAVPQGANMGLGCGNPQGHRLAGTRGSCGGPR